MKQLYKLGSNRMIAILEKALQKVRDLKNLHRTAEAAEELEKSIIGGLSVMRSKWAEFVY